jgi:hypothetical protein
MYPGRIGAPFHFFSSVFIVSRLEGKAKCRFGKLPFHLILCEAMNDGRIDAFSRTEPVFIYTPIRHLSQCLLRK